MSGACINLEHGIRANAPLRIGWECFADMILLLTLAAEEKMHRFFLQQEIAEVFFVRQLTQKTTSGRNNDV